MKMHTYVNFAGQCAEAFRFYEKHLGGKVGMMMTHGQAPDQSKVSPEMKDTVLHARLSVGGTELMAADIPSAQPMRSAYLSLGVDSDAEAERIFSALSEGSGGLLCRPHGQPPPQCVGDEIRCVLLHEVSRARHSDERQILLEPVPRP